MSPSSTTPNESGGAPRVRSRPPGVWRTARRWLYVFHRWTGIILCLLFAIWFVSGVVMMYVPFPSFRAPERIAAAPPIDWSRVRVGPDAALTHLQEQSFPSEMRLDMVTGEPVYHVVTETGRRAISVETGGEILSLDAERAGAIASALVGAPVETVSSVVRDTTTHERFWNWLFAVPHSFELPLLLQ